MTKDQVRSVVRHFLKNDSATDSAIAKALGMTKGNFSKYKDPLNGGSVKYVKAWCFDHFDDVASVIPKSWLKSSE